VEMQGGFRLTQTQIENESKDQAGLRVARLVARTLALAEDLVLLRGKVAIESSNLIVGGGAAQSPKIQVLSPKSVQDGLLQDASGTPIKVPSASYPTDFIKLVSDGIASLTSIGELGPYALLIAEDQYSKLYRIPGSLSVTYENLLKQSVTGGLYPTGALRKLKGTGSFGLLASLSGGPVSVYIGSEPRVAFIQSDPNGVLQFRVSERVQYVVRNKQALVRLEFE